MALDNSNKCRAWCFTLNNWTAEELAHIRIITCKYLVFGFETGENGTKHLQGYVYFNNSRSLSAIKKDIPRGHLEPAKGSGEQNFVYCSKDGNFEERGVRPQDPKDQGDKGKEYWDNVKMLCIEGRIDELDSKIYVTRYQGLKAIQKDHMKNKPSLAHTTGEWWFGVSGTGKSRWAREHYPDAYIKGVNKWWDGYRGEETVIIEDIDKYNVSMGGDLKRWCDHYSFPAEIKGGCMNIRPLRIIITSQYKIEEIWDDGATQDALLRRCKQRKFVLGSNAYI